MLNYYIIINLAQKHRLSPVQHLQFQRKLTRKANQESLFQAYRDDCAISRLGCLIDWKPIVPPLFTPILIIG